MDAKLSNRSISDVLLSIGLSKQLTFRVGSTGDVWHSILLTCHYLLPRHFPDLDSASDWSYRWWRPLTGKPPPRSQGFLSCIKIDKERTLVGTAFMGTYIVPTLSISLESVVSLLISYYFQCFRSFSMFYNFYICTLITMLPLRTF